MKVNIDSNHSKLLKIRYQFVHENDRKRTPKPAPSRSRSGEKRECGCATTTQQVPPQRQQRCVRALQACDDQSPTLHSPYRRAKLNGCCCGGGAWCG
jgi:hypothetical protein